MNSDAIKSLLMIDHDGKPTGALNFQFLLRTGVV